MMTWGEKILHSLRGQKELEKQLTFGFLPQRLAKPYAAAYEHDGLTVRVDVEDFDGFGVLLRSMHFEFAAESEESDPADRFDRQLRRLREEDGHLHGALCLIERDDDAQHAIIRTVPNSSRRFFEIELTGAQEAKLTHFAVDAATHKRTQTTANMSMESFLGAVDQLFDVFGSDRSE
jgi:hypothetical protein